MKVQGAPPQVGVGQPYSVEYYYKLPWGRQEEFLQLFLKNHYRCWRRFVRRADSGAEDRDAGVPHDRGRAMDYRVTIRYKDSTVATTANPDEEAFKKELWPDQAMFAKEEQRRFEILLAHWDLPVTILLRPGLKPIPLAAMIRGAEAPRSLRRTGKGTPPFRNERGMGGADSSC